MSTRERDAPQPHDLAQTTRDAAARLDVEIAAARPVPDFSAMLARARELAPEAVPAAASERAAALAPVIPLGRGERRAVRGDGDALAPFTAALRAELDAKLAERRMSSIPPLRVSTGRGRIGLAVGLAVAVAAALVLMFVRPAQLDRGGGGLAVEANAEGANAPHGEARRAGDGPATPVHEAVVRAAHAVREDSRDAAAGEGVREDMSNATGDGASRDAAPGERVHAQEDMSDGPGDDAQPPVREATRRAAPQRRPRPAEPQRPSLEDEAQALWERGELVAAERKYRELLAVAGRGGRAELAYGDLFALVRQIRGADGQVAVWREYLERFPAGRFADDARAGLCLRAAAGSRGACWRDYLERHPQGTHRRQAEATLAAEEAP